MTTPADAAILLVEMVILLVFVTFAVGLLQRRMGDDVIRRWMGGPPKRSALKGIALGFVTPFCTYSAIPVLIGMRQAGVRPAGYSAFIMAAPVVDPILIGALAIIVGPTGAGVYVTVAFVAAFSLALVVDAVDITPHLKALPVPATTPASARKASSSAESREAEPSCDASAGEAPWVGWRTESAAAWRRSLTLLRKMASLIVGGVGLGLGIALLMPADAIASVAGSENPLAIPAAAAIGVPFYVGTELFVPIGDALHTSGVGVGAIVALTIAGAGANIPEFALLTTLAKRGLVAVFFAYVFGVAVVGGLIAEVIV